MNAEPLPPWTEADHRGSVFDRFSRTVSAAPNHPAVRDESGAVLTYLELSNASQSLAQRLVKRLGAGPGHVGLVAPLRIETIIGVMGIVAAGKAYVPVDPAESIDAAKRKLGDAGTSFVVAPMSHAGLAESLLPVEGETVVVESGDTQPGSAAALPSVDPSSHFNLIYTSGSTGRPKGVIQTHRNVLFDSDASARIMPAGPVDVFGLVVPLTFGASVSDVAGALLNGATLDLFDVKVSGIDTMANWMRDREITNTHLVPTVFRRWMQAIEPSQRYPSMRMVKVGGESLLRTDFEAFARVFPEQCILRNGLGTTETYLISAELLTPTDSPDGPILPVGVEAPGRSVSIVGADRQPLEAGEIGEIAVTSRYLSPGYWNSPEATAAAFSAAPTDPELRTYYTKDLGRIRSDGRLEHLGRIDDMVKVMGRRVELSEVEASLLSMPTVKEAVVTATTSKDGTTRLVAYVVPRSTMPAATELRNGLARSLSSHMIPSRFIEMTALPTLRFGKVDRRALPDPGSLDDEFSEGRASPRTPLETQIAGLVAGLLDQESLGVEEDLFGLGLDSLSATRLVTHLNTTLGLDLTVESVFDHPTVAAIAAIAADVQRSDEAVDLEAMVSELEDIDDEQAAELLGDSLS